MSFRKMPTIRVSERVFDLVCEALETECENGAKIYGFLECFVNCREQGYVMAVYSTDFSTEEHPCDLHIWACESRNSDDIMVVWDTETPDLAGNLFSENAYNNNRKYFRFGEYQKAADYIIELVKEHFKKEFTPRLQREVLDINELFR